MLFAGPLAALLAGRALRRALSARARLAWTASALTVFAVAFTPVSLPGVIADHIVLGLAYTVLWVAAGASPRVVRYGALGLFGALVLSSVMLRWPLLMLMFLGDLTTVPFQTLDLDCRQTVRMQRYGWVANSGTEVVVVKRPAGLPVEVELGRQQFDDMRYESAGFSARETREIGGRCGVAVMYRGAEVWYVK